MPTITPPPKAQEMIAKTAGYISRNGPSFAQRLVSDPKFSFLLPKDPFHGYYLECLEKEKNKPQTSQKTVNNAPTKKQEPRPPSPFKHHFPLPPMSALDRDIILLTARYVACLPKKHQEKFFQHVRRISPLQFEFLRPQHRLNAFYLHMVESYKEALKEVEIKEDATVLESAYKRAVYAEKTAQKAQKEAELLRKQKEEFASVDWTDFKIVQTVEFTEADQYAELEQPLVKNNLIYRSLQQKNASRLIEEAVPGGMESSGPSDSRPEKTERNYRMRSGIRARDRPASRMVISPITGELVPEELLDLQMRILLRDPTHSQQKDNYNAKNNAVGSNLATDEVYNNIKRLRGASGPGEKRQKTDGVQWDGYKNTAAKALHEAQVSKEEEERLRKEREALENRIGAKFK